jgi:hypothetical protein
MQKSGLKEPIYLTKLKRKSKIDEALPQRHEFIKENNKYDLQVVQESLDTQKVRQTYQITDRVNESAFNSQNNYRPKSTSINVLSNR